MALGVEGRVLSNNREAGLMTLQIDGTAVVLGQQAAEQLLVDQV